MKHVQLFEQYLNENTDPVKEIAKKIRSKTKSSNVHYFGSNEKMKIGDHEDAVPYSAQSYENGETKVSFNLPGKMIVYSTKVDKPFEDRKSYEKYGGIIYLYEPLDNKIAAELLQKIFK
jgi:hypothetical protein